MSKIGELFGIPVPGITPGVASEILRRQECPYTETKCFKVRKSEPEISIGTCAVKHGRKNRDIIICPNRMLQKKQIFLDCIHLLTRHEPGNEFHIVSEIKVPGGSVDYFLVSAKNGKARDFAGIEVQTLDTTGTAWPERQRLLQQQGIEVDNSAVESTKRFGMNWKMTAKTALVQIHHKIDTFEHSGKCLILVIQDCLLDYMQREFDFRHLSDSGKIGDSMHIHSYALRTEGKNYTIALDKRLSTDAKGVAACLGLKSDAKVELARILEEIEQRLSGETLLRLI